MRPAGLEQVEAAKGDGRWEAAYEGQASETRERRLRKFVTMLERGERLHP